MQIGQVNFRSFSAIYYWEEQCGIPRSCSSTTLVDLDLDSTDLYSSILGTLSYMYILCKKEICLHNENLPRVPEELLRSSPAPSLAFPRNAGDVRKKPSTSAFLRNAFLEKGSRFPIVQLCRIIIQGASKG